MHKIYLKIIILTLVSLAVGLTLSGCSDDMLNNDAYDDIEPGLPATVTLEWSIGDMPAKSRADMTGNADREINSIWIGLFDRNGDKIAEYSTAASDEIGSTIANLDNDTRTVRFDTYSGIYKIAAVANPVGNYGVTTTTTTDLLELLQNTRSLDEFANIAVRQTPGNVGTPSGNLVMQGVYLADGVHPANATSDFWASALTGTENTVRVPKGTTKIGGKIHFRRIVSQVKFNFIPGDNIKDFEILSATIYNVPTLSWIAERADGTPGNDVTNAGDVIDSNEAEYASSQRFYTFTNGEDGRKSIDWWQMENRRHAVTEVHTYGQRERERQEPLYGNYVSNTGKYVALCGESGNNYDHNNNATYIVVNARLTFNNIPQGVDERIAETTYVIHLGNIEGSSDKEKFGDFNCRRNYKYTYNVTIHDVNTIYMEAHSSELDGADFNHGAEGSISDIVGLYFSADAHFEQYNIYLTEEDIKSLKWAMVVPTADEGVKRYNSDNYAAFIGKEKKYMNWITFAKAPSENVFATYHPDNVIPIWQSTVIRDTHPELLPEGWYTVFIDEYVYEDDESNVTRGNTTPNWKKYVNLPDRSCTLYSALRVSADQESQYLYSRYVLQQRSIQTYYGTEPSDYGQAIGLEHINEYQGRPIIRLRNSSATPKTSWNGRYDVIKQLEIESKPLWSRYVDLSTAQTNGDNKTQGVPKMSVQVAQALCLNRNRDLNGNGKIDQEEVRWFLPDLVQLQNFSISAKSLKTPLIDYSKYTPGENGTGSSTDLMNDHKYAASDDWFLWAAETLATGYQAGQTEVRAIRCARYLGVDMTTPVEQLGHRPAPKPYRLEGQNRIRFYYGKESTRGLTSGWFGMHHENSEFNVPSRMLEYKTEKLIISPDGDNLLTAAFRKYNGQDWFQRQNSGRIANASVWDGFNLMDPCAYMYNTAYERGWRSATQAEIAVLLDLDLLDNDIVNNTRGAYVCYIMPEFAYLYPQPPASEGQMRLFMLEMNNRNITAAPAAKFWQSKNLHAVKCVRDVLP